MAKIEATIGKDGKVLVHVDLPEGGRCDQADEELRAVMALLGAEFDEGALKPKQPEVASQKTRTKGH